MAGMQLSYELTEQDFLEAQLFHRNRSRAFLFLVAVMGIFAAFSAYNCLSRPQSDAISCLLPLVIVLAFWALALWWLPKRRPRSLYRNQPGVHGPMSLIVDDEGIQEKGALASSQAKWQSLIRWRETKNTFMIYPSPCTFYAVPKRAFTPEQLDEFRALLGNNVKPPK
jgi:hypothetical protein